MCDLCLPRRHVLAGLAAAPLVGLIGSGEPVTAQAGSGLTINPRSAWAGADRPTRGAIDPEDVRFLLVHHTAGRTEYAETEVAQLIRNIYDFHTGPEKGWPDIAYNFLIDRFGGVWEGREGSLTSAVRGDATGGNQGYSQLVCVMGTFSSELPTAAAGEALVATLAWLADRHGLNTAPGATTSFDSLGSNRHSVGTSVTTPVITGHRSMSQTSCPGDALFGWVESGLMADVSARRTGVANSSQSTTTQPDDEPSTSASSATSVSATVSTPTDDAITSVSRSEPGSSASVSAVSPTTGTVADVSNTQIAGTRAATTAETESLAAGSERTATRAGDELAGWQYLGLAGAGAAAAGLLALRRRAEQAGE